MAYMRLGDLLVSTGAISREQLEQALELQKGTKQRLGDVLIQNGFITEKSLIDALKIQLGIEFIDLTKVSLPIELAKFVPKNIARRFCVVPVRAAADALYLAMSDPLDFMAQEEVKAALRDILAEMISDDAGVRKRLRVVCMAGGELVSKAAKEEDSVYSLYYDFHEPLHKIAGHRVLAVNRGEREEFLKVSIRFDREKALRIV